MAYRFKSHLTSFRRGLSHFFPFLFLVQIPEGMLTLIQKFSDTELSDSPKLVFFVLYPLYTITAAICSALNFMILWKGITRFSDFSQIWKTLSETIRPLILTSLALGLLMIPATLALVLPGIYVLSLYLFIPFLILKNPGQALSVYFFRSKVLSGKYFGVCFVSASFSFALSFLSYLSFSSADQIGGNARWLNLFVNSGLGIAIEIVAGTLLSILLNTWISTLFLEVSAHEGLSA